MRCLVERERGADDISKQKHSLPADLDHQVHQHASNNKYKRAHIYTSIETVVL